LNPNVEIDKVALNTPGYVGADINSLIDEALISALDRFVDLKKKQFLKSKLMRL
jgi:SpoVK/Ycf46/Vps4 family AAA+-type ATPase